jgi:hypothetical protein
VRERRNLRLESGFAEFSDSEKYVNPGSSLKFLLLHAKLCVDEKVGARFFEAGI